MSQADAAMAIAPNLLASVRQCRDEIELRTLILKVLASLGARDFLYVTYVDEDEPLKGTPRISIWSGRLPDYCRRYVQAEHHLRDPALTHGRFSALPLRLSTLATMAGESTRIYREELRKFGLTHGLAIPVHGGRHDPLELFVVFPHEDTQAGEGVLLSRDGALRALAHEVKAWCRRDARNAILSCAALGDQDIELLQFIYRGFTKQEIAEHMRVPHSRIKTASQRLCGQFHVRTIEAAARVAVQVGIVRLLG